MLKFLNYLLWRQSKSLLKKAGSHQIYQAEQYEGAIDCDMMSLEEFYSPRLSYSCQFSWDIAQYPCSSSDLRRKRLEIKHKNDVIFHREDQTEKEINNSFQKDSLFDKAGWQASWQYADEHT